MAPRVLLVEEGGIGGVAEYTGELARALARAGCEVHLATGCNHAPGPGPRKCDLAPTLGEQGQPTPTPEPTPTPGSAPEPAPDVVLHRVFPYVRGRGRLGRLVRRLHLSRPVNGATHLAANLAVARLARRCDVVHVQGGEWPPLSAAQALMLRAARCPIVYTPHNTFDRGGRSHPRAHALIRRCAARIVIHAEHDRAALSAAQAAKAVVIPHGEYGGQARRGAWRSDPDTARAGLGLGGDELVVLLFGQLRPDKGVRDLLGAAAEMSGAQVAGTRVAESPPAVRVVLAGEDLGALDEVADLLADERLRGRVLVRAGFVAPDAMGELFAAADVVALPYLRASASGVLLLAYGYARPVLVYPVGGLPEYVQDGRTGWVCERADVASLTELLRSIAAAGRSQCRARGAAAQRLSQERFGWDSIAERTIALYESAIEDSRRHP